MLSTLRTTFFRACCVVALSLIGSMSNFSVAAGTYASTFDLEENPLSESGAWRRAVNNFTNVKSSGGVAFGTNGITNQYDDSYALLSGFGADQTVEAVVQRSSSLNTNVTHEAELLLRFSDSSSGARGYECLFAFYGAVQVVRWNGTQGDYTVLPTLAGTGSLGRQLLTGDVIKASISGNVINVYINGTLMMRTSDSAFTTGQPGIGFFTRPGGNSAHLALTQITATSDGATSPPPPSAPAVSLSASPTSVAFGGSTALSWSTTDATSCVASGAWSGTRATSGNENSAALSNNPSAFTLTCTGPGGQTSRTVNVSVASPPPSAPTVTLSASPTSVAFGGSTALTWSSTNATSCAASGAWSGTRATSGSENSAALSNSPSAFTLTCTGAGGQTSRTVNVTVGSAPPPVPTVTLSASPTSVAFGGTTALSWSSTNATSCTASGVWSGARSTAGSETSASLSNSTSSFTLTCTGAGGQASRTVDVAVAAAPSSSGSYSSSFDREENPLSESGVWRRAANNFTNVRSSGGLAFGTNGITNEYDDSYALLSGFAADQTVEAVVQRSASLNTSVTHNAELLLRFTDSTSGARGYECLFASYGAVQVIRKNGNRSDFTVLSTTAGLGGLGRELRTGDVLKATVIGNVINLYINGTLMARATDSTYPTGQPGIGFFTRPGGNTAHLAFTQVTATSEGTASPPPTSPPVPVVTLSASPTSVTAGGTTALTWSSTDATSCAASGAWSGTRTTAGSENSAALSTSPSAFTLTCTGPGGQASRTVNVTVTSPPPSAPVVNLSASPASVAFGGTTALTWSTTNASSCTASGVWSGTRATAGSENSVALSSNPSAFTLTCTGPGGQTSRTANVTVGSPPPPAPIVTLSASPTSVAFGGTTALTWSTTNATSCTASGEWSGARATAGSESSAALSNSTSSFTLTCSGAGGQASRTVNVTVTAAPPSSGSYSSNFNLEENPLSESGAWRRAANNFTNVKSSGGLAFGTNGITNQYDDSYALLSGFGPDQTVEAVVQRSASLNTNVTHNVELMLRVTDSTTGARGYECLFASYGQVQVIRWNGTQGDHTVLPTVAGSANLGRQLLTGDVIKATISGNVINLYINGTMVMRTTDSAITTGQPGIGFFIRPGGNSAHLALTQVTATSQ